MAVTDPLSEHDLLRVARDLKADQLRSLPAERVNARIPARMMAAMGAPSSNTAAELPLVEGETGDTGSTPADAGSQPALSNLDPEPAAVLAAAEAIDSEGVERLTELTARVDSRPRATWSDTSDWLDEPAQEREEMRSLAATLAADACAAEVLLEQLGDMRPEDQVARARVTEACARLPRHLATLESALAGYHALELDLVAAEMRGRRAECELEARRLRELTEQIESVEAQLRGRRGGLLGLLRRRPRSDQRDHLVSRLRELRARRDRPSEFLRDGEVPSWLQTLMMAGIHMTPEAWDEASAEARGLLYPLLNVLSLQPHLPPHRLAARTLTRRDTRAVFEYCPESELYLTRYFARQRLDLFDGPRPVTAKRLERFRHVRETLLREYHAGAERG